MANKRFASLFSVFTVNKKKASSKETKTAIQATPFKKLNLSICLFIYNKYNILVGVTKRRDSSLYT
jgi:hypothetical protein